MGDGGQCEDGGDWGEEGRCGEGVEDLNTYLCLNVDGRVLLVLVISERHVELGAPPAVHLLIASRLAQLGDILSALGSGGLGVDTGLEVLLRLLAEHSARGSEKN